MARGGGQITRHDYSDFAFYDGQPLIITNGHLDSWHLLRDAMEASPTHNEIPSIQRDDLAIWKQFIQDLAGALIVGVAKRWHNYYLLAIKKFA